MVGWLFRSLLEKAHLGLLLLCCVRLHLRWVALTQGYISVPLWGCSPSLADVFILISAISQGSFHPRWRWRRGRRQTHKSPVDTRGKRRDGRRADWCFGSRPGYGCWHRIELGRQNKPKWTPIWFVGKWSPCPPRPRCSLSAGLSKFQGSAKFTEWLFWKPNRIRIGRGAGQRSE